MKDFFHFNKAKVIGTVVIAVLNIGLAMYSAQAILCTHNCLAPNAWQSFWAFTIQPLAMWLLSVEFFETLGFLSDSFIFGLSLLVSGAVLLLFWYLVACGLYAITSLLNTHVRGRIVMVVFICLAIILFAPAIPSQYVFQTEAQKEQQVEFCKSHSCGGGGAALISPYDYVTSSLYNLIVRN